MSSVFCLLPFSVCLVERIRQGGQPEESADFERQGRAIEQQAMSVQDIPTEQDERLFGMGDHLDRLRGQSTQRQLDRVSANEENLSPETSDWDLIKG